MNNYWAELDELDDIKLCDEVKAEKALSMPFDVYPVRQRWAK